MSTPSIRSFRKKSGSTMVPMQRMVTSITQIGISTLVTILVPMQRMGTSMVTLLCCQRRSIWIFLK